MTVALTGTFLSSWILYLSRNVGLPVKSTNVKSALATENTITKKIGVPSGVCACACVCVCVCACECVFVCISKIKEVHKIER